MIFWCIFLNFYCYGHLYTLSSFCLKKGFSFILLFFLFPPLSFFLSFFLLSFFLRLSFIFLFLRFYFTRGPIKVDSFLHIDHFSLRNFSTQTLLFKPCPIVFCFCPLDYLHLADLLSQCQLLKILVTLYSWRPLFDFDYFICRTNIQFTNDSYYRSTVFFYHFISLFFYFFNLFAASSNLLWLFVRL